MNHCALLKHLTHGFAVLQTEGNCMYAHTHKHSPSHILFTTLMWLLSHVCRQRKSSGQEACLPWGVIFTGGFCVGLFFSAWLFAAQSSIEHARKLRAMFEKQQRFDARPAVPRCRRIITNIGMSRLDAYQPGVLLSWMFMWFYSAKWLFSTNRFYNDLRYIAKNHL